MMMLMIGMIVADKIFQAPAGSSAHSFNPPPSSRRFGPSEKRGSRGETPAAAAAPGKQ